MTVISHGLKKYVIYVHTLLQVVHSSVLLLMLNVLFNRSANTILGKVGRLEEVTIELVRTKCLPILVYGLE